jgi:ubiquinone/menaquinone biosynthesis C-methylase UbiE
VEQCSTEHLAILAQASEPLPGEGYYALDVGCGYSSRIGRNAFGKTVSVVGADAMSQPLMDILSRAKIPFPHPIINILAEDLGLVWPAQTFDLIVCKNALPEFMDPVQAVNQMARLLKPGGTLLIDFVEVAKDEEKDTPLRTFDVWTTSESSGSILFQRGDAKHVVSRVGELEFEFSEGAKHLHKRFKMRRPKSGLVLAR